MGESEAGVSKGKVVIVATGGKGNSVVFDKSSEPQNAQVFNAVTNIFPEAHLFADSRQSASKKNKLFAYSVYKALKEGCNFVLITPDEKMIDKRIRNIATVIKLPQ